MSFLRLSCFHLTGVCVLGIVSSVSRADVLAQYSFTSGALAPTTVDTADFTASNLTRGATFNSPASFTTDWIYAQGSQTPSSNPASASTAYFTVTLTPKAGVTSYSLTSLTFGAAFYESGGASNTSYTTNYVVRSSILGYASDIASFAEVGQTTTSPTFHLKTVDLSGSNYQNLTGAVTFRIYAWDGITGGSRLSSMDNLTINGSIPTSIPEPSVMVLASGLVIGGFAVLRRRRRSA